MKDYKVKISIIDNDNNGKSLISTLVSSEIIKNMKEYHNLSALDETLDMLLVKLKENQQ